MSEDPRNAHRRRARPVARAVVSSAASISILGLLVYGPFLLPSTWLLTSFLAAALSRCYNLLCWSHSFFDPIFPSQGSVYSSECHMAMLAANVLILAAIIFALLTVCARVYSNRNA